MNKHWTGPKELIDGYSYKKHPLYARWTCMKDRCRNPNSKDYHKYGERGITVCEEWLDFKNYVRDIGLPPYESASVDRIDNTKGYCKDNCRWATKKEQTDNRRVMNNNSCGYDGVFKREKSFYASVVDNYKKYYLGSFPTLEEAIEFRKQFVVVLKQDKDKANQIVKEQKLKKSSTGVQNIHKHKNGFQITIKGKYLGFYKTLEEAKRALEGLNVIRSNN